MGSINIPGAGSPSWKSPVATSGDLPSTGNQLGDARIVTGENTVYTWNGSSWVSAGGSISVTDTASVDLSFSLGTLQADVLPAGVSHNSLANLTTGDAHTQYALLAGRSGGQTISGGTAASNNLTLDSTTNGTKGSVRLNSRLDFATDGTRTIGQSSGNRPSTIFATTGIQLGTSASSIDGSLASNSLDFRTRALGQSDSAMAHMAMFEGGGGARPRLQLYNHGSNGGINFQFNAGAGTCGSIGDFGDANNAANYSAGTAPHNIAVTNALIWDTDGSGDIGTSTGNRPATIYALTNINLASLTASVPVVTDASKNLVSQSFATFAGNLTHNNLGGLTTGDPHTQYFTVTGRTNENLTFSGTGVALSTNGSVTNPSFGFAGDPDNGLYLASSNTPGMAASGRGCVNFTTTSSSRRIVNPANSSTYMEFNDAGVERIQIATVNSITITVDGKFVFAGAVDGAFGEADFYGPMRMSSTYGSTGVDMWWQADGGGDVGRSSQRPNIGRFKAGLGVGLNSLHASAILQADSTTQGFLPPRMTETERDAIATPAAGLIIYNTTEGKLNVYTTAWETITSA